MPAYDLVLTGGGAWWRLLRSAAGYQGETTARLRSGYLRLAGAVE